MAWRLCECVLGANGGFQGDTSLSPAYALATDICIEIRSIFTPHTNGINNIELMRWEPSTGLARWWTNQEQASLLYYLSWSQLDARMMIYVCIEDLHKAMSSSSHLWKWKCWLDFFFFFILFVLETPVWRISRHFKPPVSLRYVSDWHSIDIHGGITWHWHTSNQQNQWNSLCFVVVHYSTTFFLCFFFIHSIVCYNN